MKFVPRLICLIVLIFTFVQFSFAQSKDWQPVSQTELQMKTPQVEPDSDAEVLFWEVRVVDDFIPRAGWQSVLNHHIRIKIFTDRGRENNSKVDIPYGNISDFSARVSIKDIFARTIKSDGTIVELKSEEVFERDIVKGNGVKVKAKSFAVPGIETGAIIEYRWKEIRNGTFNHTRIELAREIPVQFVKYYIRPAKVTLGMRLHSFNTDGSFVQEAEGLYSTTMKNVAAFREEPRMPSEYDIKPWVLVYYDNDDEKQSAESYWKDFGKKTFEYHKNLIKENSDTKKAAVQAIGEATESQEKIRRLWDFCHKNIKDINDDALGLTADQRKNIKENKNTSDTLKHGMGNWHEIGMVFAAMLISAGFDARVANVAVRTDARFDSQMANDYFLRTEIIAVKVGSRWQFYDLSNHYLPFGMLTWAIEGQTVLISDSDKSIWEKIPTATSAESNQKRTAKLRLTEDGSLEGNIRIEYTGHFADFYKEYNDDDSPTEREKYLIETIRRQIGSTAEITNIAIENLQDAEKPFVYTFKIRVPAYAERTGKRIFLRPNIFKRNTGAMFISSVRKYDISFEYLWSEDDEIIFELPAGYSLEAADSPKPIKDERYGGSHETKISVSDDKKLLTYQRKFSFGKADSLRIYDINYQAVKRIFESFYTADSHTLILREDSSKTN